MMKQFYSHFGILIGVLIVTLRASAEEPQRNLVQNGDFELGTGKEAAFWSPLDGLTVRREKADEKGFSLVMDTQVTRTAKRASKDGLPLPEEITSRQGEAGQYDTVGAHEGVWAFATPVKLPEKQDYFILSADVKGPRSTIIFYPQVFLRGFQRVSAKDAGRNSSWFHQPFAAGPAFSEQFGSNEQRRDSREGDYLMVWRKSLICRLEMDGTWQSFKVAVKLPKTKRYRPEVMLVKPYAMWPLGIYAFDNICLIPCDKATYDQVRKVAHSAAAFE